LILVDTGPLVALFDRRDSSHARCRDALAGIREHLVTTVPVLTEAFHLLSPASRGSLAMREFIGAGGLDVWYMDRTSLNRCFELMVKYADLPMDLADASLVAAAEALRTTRVFTIDRADFDAYRARIGKSYRAFARIG
jgi:uncharacterized protein